MPAQLEQISLVISPISLTSCTVSFVLNCLKALSAVGRLDLLKRRNASKAFLFLLPNSVSVYSMQMLSPVATCLWRCLSKRRQLTMSSERNLIKHEASMNSCRNPSLERNRSICKRFRSTISWSSI